ncbi:hypothetical protein DFJ74DRAFT_654331 [Hyaloraphidium curvatum]|nr:hypothetical protein DFJ74DRAFT_654331 [Hyaloraphidium curvatum]
MAASTILWAAPAFGDILGGIALLLGRGDLVAGAVDGQAAPLGLQPVAPIFAPKEPTPSLKVLGVAFAALGFFELVLRDNEEFLAASVATHALAGAALAGMAASGQLPSGIGVLAATDYMMGSMHAALLVSKAGVEGAAAAADRVVPLVGPAIRAAAPLWRALGYSK